MKILVLAAFAAAALVLPASASVKEIVSLELCGAAGCKTLTNQSRPLEVGIEGEQYAHPPRPSGFYTIKGTVDIGEGRTVTWTMYYIPSGYVRSTDEHGNAAWMKLIPSGAAELRTLSDGIEPFAAPVVTYASVGKRMVKEPASYLRLYELKSAGVRAPRNDWVRIVLRSPEPSPWTDGHNDLEYQASTGLLLRDGEYVLLSKALASRVRRGLSLVEPSRHGAVVKGGVAGLGVLVALAVARMRARR